MTGVDLNCGSWLSTYTQGAVDQKLVNKSVIDRAISNNFATLMRLGFFDGNPRNRIYGNLGPKDVCTPENQDLAREAARQGIVLLKNTAGSLPLIPTAIKSLAVIGPNANVTKTMIGNYEGTHRNSFIYKDFISDLVLSIIFGFCRHSMQVHNSLARSNSLSCHNLQARMC